MLYKKVQLPWKTVCHAWVQAKSLELCPTLRDAMDCSLPAPLSMGFSRQEYWSGLPCPPPGELLDPGIKPTSLTSPALADKGFPGGSTGKESVCNAGDLGSIPGWGRCPEEGKGYPLQYSGQENSMVYSTGLQSRT